MFTNVYVFMPSHGVERGCKKRELWSRCVYVSIVPCLQPVRYSSLSAGILIAVFVYQVLKTYRIGLKSSIERMCGCMCAGLVPSSTPSCTGNAD